MAAVCRATRRPPARREASSAARRVRWPATRKSGRPAVPGSSTAVVPGSSMAVPRSPGCPWVVDALPGQRINFTLMDFFQRHRTTASGDDNHGLQQPGKTSIRHFSGHSPRTYPPDSSPPRQFPSPLRTFSLTCYSENLKFCTVNTRFM